MRPLLALVIVSLASWLAASFVVDGQTSIEILFGMLGPLLAVAVTWVLAARVSQRRPQAMMSLMVAGFAIKLVFFGAYLTVMLRVLSLRPVPFVVSFTGYFIVLYLIEALYLKRLFWGGMRASR
jgi:hypothetical protein